MKNNQHKKRTFIDRFARNFYCQHARLNYLRADKHKAIRDERHYQKSLTMGVDNVEVSVFDIDNRCEAEEYYRKNLTRSDVVKCAKCCIVGACECCQLEDSQDLDCEGILFTLLDDMVDS